MGSINDKPKEKKIFVPFRIRRSQMSTVQLFVNIMLSIRCVPRLLFHILLLPTKSVHVTAKIVGTFRPLNKHVRICKRFFDQMNFFSISCLSEMIVSHLNCRSLKSPHIMKSKNSKNHPVNSSAANRTCYLVTPKTTFFFSLQMIITFKQFFFYFISLNI